MQNQIFSTYKQGENRVTSTILAVFSHLSINALTQIVHENLIPEDPSTRAIVIPAGFAYHEYEQYSAYICQPNRSFRPSAYFAFYTHNRIKRYVSKVLGIIHCVSLKNATLNKVDIFDFNHRKMKGKERDKILERLEGMKQENLDRFNDDAMIFVLSNMDESDTITLSDEIINDKKSQASGRGVAYVQNQGYVHVEKLKLAKFTSDLD